MRQGEKRKETFLKYATVSQRATAVLDLLLLLLFLPRLQLFLLLLVLPLLLLLLLPPVSALVIVASLGKVQFP